MLCLVPQIHILSHIFNCHNRGKKILHTFFRKDITQSQEMHVYMKKTQPQAQDASLSIALAQTRPYVDSMTVCQVWEYSTHTIIGNLLERRRIVLKSTNKNKLHVLFLQRYERPAEDGKNAWLGMERFPII